MEQNKTCGANLPQNWYFLDHPNVVSTYQNVMSLFLQSPSHMYSGLQQIPAQLHFWMPLHATKHPQWSNSVQTLFASRRLVQFGIHVLVLSFHSQPIYLNLEGGEF
jgi:hypothetical protein